MNIPPPPPPPLNRACYGPGNRYTVFYTTYKAIVRRYTGHVLKKGNSTLACHCALNAGCMVVVFARP